MPDTPIVTYKSKPVEINPLTGLPMGGTPTIDTTGPQEVPINPLTGNPMQNVRPGVTLGGGAGTPDLMQSQLYGSQYNTYRKDNINRYLKYDVPLGQDLDWDEIRARNQSTADKWGNGLAKMGVTALGAITENTIGFLAGMGEMINGGSYYDNSVGKTVDRVNEWMREHMPNYYTQREQEMSVLQGMGTANFWADKVAGGIGYSLGSIATMYLTGGGGLLTKGASAMARQMGIYNATKAIINGTSLAKNITQGASLATRIRRATQMLEAGAMMSFAEGSVESRETQKETYEMLVNQYLQERPGMSEADIPADKLRQFENTSYAAGNTNFLLQMPVLMGTNLLMFGKQVTGFKGMSQANADVMFDSAARKAVNRLAEQGIVAQSLSRLRPVFMNGIGETMQESLQFGSGAFSSTYHTDKYNNGGHGDMSKALAAAGDAMLSKEGLESALIGFLTGGIMGGGQSVIGKTYATRKSNAQALTDLINSGIFDKANQRYGTAEASSAVLKRMHDALQKGDIKKFKDEQYKLIQYQALEALERGGFDVMVQKLEDSKNLSETEFMEYYGYPQEDNSGKPLTLKDSTDKSQDEVIDGVIEKLKRFEQTYDTVNERFPLQDKTSGLPRLLMSTEERAAEDAVYNKQVNLRNNLIFYGSEIKDRNRRMDAITNQMQDTLNDSLQGSAYAGTGPQLDVHGALQEQRPSFKGIDLLKDETGEVEPATEYDATEQLKNTGKKLQQIADNLRLTDPIAADKFTQQAKDYMELLRDNNTALDAYNKLSSDSYAQEQMQKEIEEREAVAKQNKIDKAVTEAVDKAETPQDFDNVDLENASPEIAAKGKAKLMELRDAEFAEYRKYMAENPNENDNEKLERLKKIDKTKLTSIQKAGLAKAINTLENKLNEDPDTTEEAPSREEDNVMEEAFQPDNVGGVELISEDGRKFQVDGVELHNRELNPLDAIVRTRAGRIKQINLTDKNGKRKIIWKQPTVDALAYAILMSEQLKLDTEQGKIREELLDRKEVVLEEVEKEMGRKTGHGAKTSESLRQEIYSLELGLQEILDAYDELRTSYIQDAGATKEELKNDPDLIELKKKIKSLKLQISHRRRILQVRAEDSNPTDPEILRVENKANAAIDNYNVELSESESTVKQLQDEIEYQKSLLEGYKQADDLDSWRQATNSIKNKEALILKEQAKQEKLKHKINYEQAKLKRLQDAKDNDPNKNAEPSEQTAAEQTEGPIDAREDKNIGESVEGQEPVIDEETAEEEFSNEEKATQKQATITQNSNSNTAEDPGQSEPGTPKEGIIFGLPEGMTEQDLMEEGSTTDLGGLIAPTDPQKVNIKYTEADNIYNEVFGIGNIRVLTDTAVSEAKAGAKSQKGVDPNTLTYEEAQKQFDAMLEFIEKRIRMNELLRKKGRPIMSAEQIIEEVYLKHIKGGTPGSILQYIVYSESASLKEYIRNRVEGVVTTKQASADVNKGTENTSVGDLDIKAANIDKVEKVGEDTYDKRAKRRIVVDSTGNPSRYTPDMSNGQIIKINQDLLLSPDIVGTQVTFELRTNDYFTKRVEEEGLENAWKYVPIYYKIGNEYVGKLEESDSPQRRALANKLENGEIVTTRISKVISGPRNVNHAITEDGTPFFIHPEATFGKNEVILGVANGYTQQFELGDVDSRLDQGDADAIVTGVGQTPLGKIGSGQVVAVIRPKNNPQGDARVTPLSTANLSAEAQEGVMNLLKQGELDRASQIVANSNISEGVDTNPNFIEFAEFPDGSKAIVYKSPSKGNLIRIKEGQLQKALNGEPHKYDFVKVNGDKYQVYTPQDSIVDIKKDLTNFMADKKYHVNVNLVNMATDYTNPINGKEYKSTADAPFGYQQYLFDNGNAGGRILSTDVVKLGESLFNNPQVTFEGIDKDMVGETEVELKIERNDAQIIDDIADEDISFDDKTNECK